MQINTARVRQSLKEFDFTELFVEELGWDRYRTALEVTTDGRTYSLVPVAQKRGMIAYTAEPAVGGRIPDYPIRRKIEHQVIKSAREHLIIYTDVAKTTQVWQWVRHEPGKPTACREHTFHRDQPGDALIQKLQTIAFSLEEESELTLVDVTSRVRAGFDIEKLTKRFYDYFKAEHAAFLKFLKGIPDEEMERWYVSVMLNRLMFIYFIQKKGFLDGNQDYLRDKLAASKARGKDRFYREFLCPLFFEGFAKREEERSAAANKLLGNVPYLNGGLFLKHQIEELHGRTIDIADAAFGRLFEFFDCWQWHLDERPLRKDDEINPDVLGYIFEKYINQKQMGAYYTKEDITGYISRNTIIPFLFDAAKAKCKIAFEGEQSVWRLLVVDPDRYIYSAMRRGVIDDDGQVIPEATLPEFVRKGMHDPKARMFNRDYNLGRAVIPGPDQPNLALPTETWREYVERRTRCLDLRSKLSRGEVRDLNDMITLNLDIQQFAQDVIEDCEGPELLRAFWHAIIRMTVLDPTCGSGAFLFAALNILESLYEACLDRMEVFLTELDRSGEKHRPERFSDFRKIIDRVEKHPNRKYFVFKSIVINNLYGVDIMEEAVEICKLRLFLKLVAQIERPELIEPLPDIDFNIRAGNTLVGYATYEQVKQAIQSKLDFDNTLACIEQKAEDVDRLFTLFRQQQTELGGTVTASDKQELRRRLGELENALNRYLATEYLIDPGKKAAYAAWLASHKPFHWFVDFYGIMRRGGFDVIIGNPPYLEKAKLAGAYEAIRLETQQCRDIYAWVVERALTLRREGGRTGLIVPVSIASSDSFASLRGIIASQSGSLWLSHYANRPGQLFVGAQNRLTIMLSANKSGSAQYFSTRYHRWDARGGERETLFDLLQYVALDDLAWQYHGLYTKTGTHEGVSVLRKLRTPRVVGEVLHKGSNHQVYWVRVPGYFCQFFIDPPKAKPESGGPARIRGEVISIDLPNRLTQRIAHAVLNSSAYYHFFTTYTDARHINPSDVTCFPLDFQAISQTIGQELQVLSDSLETQMRENTSLWRKSGLLIESVKSSAVKPLLDRIDTVLAKYWKFSPEEVDFIVNYDIKHRLGADAEDAGEE